MRSHVFTSVSRQIDFAPALPPLKLQLSMRMPVGSIIKTITVYKEAFWRKRGFNAMTATDSTPVSVTFDDSGEHCEHPAIMGFIQGSHARRWCEEPLERRKQAVCEQYARLFGSDEALNPVDYLEVVWSGEEWSGGCYLGYMPPGVLTEFGRVLRTPCGRIHFAGTETARTWVRDCTPWASNPAMSLTRRADGLHGRCRRGWRASCT
jgi:monoamine oxidase